MGKKDKIGKNKGIGKKTAKTGESGNEDHSDRLDERPLQGLCGVMPAKSLDLKKRNREKRGKRDSDAKKRAENKSQRKNEEII